MDFTTSATTASTDNMINVNGDQTDTCYRYKMHPLHVSYISESGGTTVIDNGEQVAHEIYRELADLKSVMAKGLSSRVFIKNNQIMIPGNYEAGKLQQILYKYIQSEVLCSKCGNPETQLWKKRKRKCNACGKIQGS